MENSGKSPSRKKFLLWATAILSSVSIVKFLPGKKKKKNETITMLSQDGTLVEIDKRLLASATSKITDKELQNWIKK